MLRDLEKIKKMVLSLAAVVEECYRKAVQSLERMDVDLARQVVGSDDHIDEMEVDLEEECLKILALHQPVATDLRFIVAVLKINNDLERISDLAVNIAERTLGLTSVGRIPVPFDLTAMAGSVEGMLVKSLDSLVHLDSTIAREVCTLDDEIDRMHKRNYQLIKDQIRRNPAHLDALVQYISVSRHLERIGDLTTNIAEDVIYMIEGEIVRHTY